MIKSLTSYLGLADVDGKLDSINEQVKMKRETRNKIGKDALGTHQKTAKSLQSPEKQEEAPMPKVKLQS